MTGSGRSWPWWRWVLTGLSTLALALSASLGWHYLVGGLVIGCVGGSPCDQVLRSRWSSVAGVRIYGTTGGNAIPKLVFGSRWVIPDPHDADDLVSILHDSLAVPKP